MSINIKMKEDPVSSVKQRKHCVDDLPIAADAVSFMLSGTIFVFACLHLANKFALSVHAWIYMYSFGGALSIFLIAATLSYARMSFREGNAYAGTTKEHVTFRYVNPSVEKRMQVAQAAGYHGTRFVRYATFALTYYVGFVLLMFIVFYTNSAAIDDLGKGFRGYAIMSLVEQVYYNVMIVGVMQLPIQLLFTFYAICNACGFTYISADP